VPDPSCRGSADRLRARHATPYPDEGTRPELREELLSSKQPAQSPLHRLRQHRPYWLDKMKVMGTICALTLSILATGYRLDWDPATGPALPVFQSNHPSASMHREFTREAVATGAAMGIMRPCSRDFLTCILPLGVVANSAGKLRLIWDGRWVNTFLRVVRFSMETLQTEGRSLFSGCSHGGTFDISQAFHHVDMDPSTFPFLGFEWEGLFYHFTVLPFGLSCAPRIFTLVMQTTVAYLRWRGCRLMVFLDDLPFAQTSIRAATHQASIMLHELEAFGWLINPDKCVGLYAALHVFKSLGTMVNLLKQQFTMTPETVTRIQTKAAALLAIRGPCPVKAVASAKGLIASTWVSTGSAASLRTRALGWVIDSAGPSCSKASWARSVPLSGAAVAELEWWSLTSNLEQVNGQDIMPRLVSGFFDSQGMSDASDTGYGGWISSTNRAHRGSLLISRLQSNPKKGISVRRACRMAEDGIEMVGHFPLSIAAGSSTLRELFGVWMYFTTFVQLMRCSRVLLGLDNICCVFILGGVLPLSATGNQESKSTPGGSRIPELQALAIKIMDLCLAQHITFVVYWTPRANNERADLLSHATSQRWHEYWLLRSEFFDLDGLWGPHSIDRFATSRNAQPLLHPNRGRFCSAFFEDEAECINSLEFNWAGENNWCFPPYRMVGQTIQHLKRCRAVGTIVVPFWVHGPFWPLLYPHGAGATPSPCVLAVRELGHGCDVLGFPSDGQRGSICERLIVAIRFDGRN
jgi:hypothetical protein